MTAPKHIQQAVDERVSVSPTLGASAGKHVLGFAWSTKSNAWLADGRMFPGEAIVRQWSVADPSGGAIWATLATSAHGDRLIISDDAQGRQAYGGLLLLRYKGRLCVHSAYTVAAYRGQGYGCVLANAAKSLGVSCALGPASADGRRWASKYDFRIVNES